MAILGECPICRKKQRIKNKVCKCGENLDKAKRSNRIKFYISYRLPGGKQRMEVVGYSIEDARAAEGKRKAQKRENPKVLEMLSDNKTTFSKLAEWYLNLESVKRLATYERVEICLNNFNKVFGDTKLSDLCLTDLEDYQIKRDRAGKAKSTIDIEVGIASAMVNKAFDNDKVSGDTLKPFRCIKNVLTRGSNARKKTITTDEYIKLLDAAQDYLKPILIIGFNTGMRLGEILKLKWSNIDRKEGFIRLTDSDTKERKEKVIPINSYIVNVFDRIIPHVNHDYVFTYRHNPLQKFTTTFKTCCKHAGIEYGRKEEKGITFHDIRRTVKTNMLKAGIDKVYRDTILGHSLRGMDTHYMAPSESDLKRNMDRYTSWLDNQLKLQFVDQNVDQKLNF
jgi:integrase